MSFFRNFFWRSGEKGGLTLAFSFPVPLFFSRAIHTRQQNREPLPQRAPQGRSQKMIQLAARALDLLHPPQRDRPEQKQQGQKPGVPPSRATGRRHIQASMARAGQQGRQWRFPNWSAKALLPPPGKEQWQSGGEQERRSYPKRIHLVCTRPKNRAAVHGAPAAPAARTIPRTKGAGLDLSALWQPNEQRRTDGPVTDADRGEGRQVPPAPARLLGFARRAHRHSSAPSSHPQTVIPWGRKKDWLV